MDTASAIARYRAFARECGWSKSRFAREAGLGLNTLRNFWSEGWNPTAETMAALDRCMAGRDAA